MTESSTDPGATGYDGLSSKLVREDDFRAFLLDCFSINEQELFVCREDRGDEALNGVPREVVFAAFCTCWPVSGDFAMGFSVGINGRLADQVGRHDFAKRIAARFDAYVLYGDDEPPGLWTLVLPDGARLRAAMNEGEDRYLLSAATAPVPGLPDLPVEKGLWHVR